MEWDDAKARRILTNAGVPADKLEEELAVMREGVERMRITTEFRADGTSTLRIVAPDGTIQTVDGTWAIAEENGNWARVRTTDAEGENVIEVEFQDDDHFRFTKDPRHVVHPVKLPTFTRKLQ